MVRTPDTPPFNDMKRVFGSNDYDTAANNFGGDVTERVVAFHKPDLMHNNQDDYDYDCDEDDYEADEAVQEDEQVKFATLEASYPTHIQQESSTMCCGGGGDHSGRQLIQEEDEDEDLEYY